MLQLASSPGPVLLKLRGGGGGNNFNKTGPGDEAMQQLEGKK